MYLKVDEETGEITKVDRPVVELQPGDMVRRKAQTEFAIEYYRETSIKEQFVWVLFVYGEQLLPNISSANLTRLMYAATFCNSDGSIMSKNELRNKMRLNKNRWSEFWNEMIQNNIFYEKDDTVYVTDSLFSKGKIKTKSNYTRLFCQYVRTLYESCYDTKDHKLISYIFKIIPFVNRRTNIVCKNPEEQDKKNIQYMRLGDFCDIIGYDRSQARRLAKELLKIRINGELAIGFFVQDLREETWVMIVNPNIYFGGKRADGMFEEQRRLFELESKEGELYEQRYSM